MKKKKRENNPLALLLILRMKVFPQCKYKGKRIMICARTVWFGCLKHLSLTVTALGVGCF